MREACKTCPLIENCPDTEKPICIVEAFLNELKLSKPGIAPYTDEDWEPAEWIPKDSGYICSKCKTYFGDAPGACSPALFKYCPECGRQMRYVK